MVNFEELKDKAASYLGVIFWIAVIVGGIYYFSSDTDTGYEPNVSGSQIYNSSEYKQDYNNSYSEHDFDVNQYQDLGGSYTVEACNSRTGSCYDLDADIDNGQVERIYFPNGGHLDLDGAEFDEDGYAVGESYTESEGYNGDEWEINCYDCE